MVPLPEPAPTGRATVIGPVCPRITTPAPPLAEILKCFMHWPVTKEPPEAPVTLVPEPPRTLPRNPPDSPTSQQLTWASSCTPLAPARPGQPRGAHWLLTVVIIPADGTHPHLYTVPTVWGNGVICCPILSPMGGFTKTPLPGTHQGPAHWVGPLGLPTAGQEGSSWSYRCLRGQHPPRSCGGLWEASSGRDKVRAGSVRAAVGSRGWTQADGPAVPGRVMTILLSQGLWSLSTTRR